MTSRAMRGDRHAVIPAKAGIHFLPEKAQWVPAFAGTT